MTKVDTKYHYIMPIDEMEEDYNVKDIIKGEDKEETSEEIEPTSVKK